MNNKPAQPCYNATFLLVSKISSKSAKYPAGFRSMGAGAAPEGQAGLSWVARPRDPSRPSGSGSPG